MEHCKDCNKEFKNKHSLANHVRSGCYTSLRKYSLCPNPQENKNCKRTFITRGNKSGLCQSCINKINYKSINLNVS